MLLSRNRYVTTKVESASVFNGTELNPFIKAMFSIEFTFSILNKLRLFMGRLSNTCFVVSSVLGFDVSPISLLLQFLQIPSFPCLLITVRKVVASDQSFFFLYYADVLNL